ncbi:hypothetical protein AB0E01_43815 [Nocardia vinacea]|uniref:hypothetical protein n=1 Tax=Nocardia vinacea TaxID=96468 RepID=UPI00340F25D0
MTDSYTIAISNSRTGVVLASATVEIDGTGARLTAVRAETSGESFVPEALAHIDFPLLVRTANMLSSSPTQANPTSTPAPAGASNPKPAESDNNTPTPTEGEDGTSTLSGGSPKRISGAHERAELQREQRKRAPTDFGVTYWRLGSISKVAKHYDVPNHIAQDWIKSLQRQGKLASPWPSKPSQPLRPR